MLLSITLRRDNTERYIEGILPHENGAGRLHRSRKRANTTAKESLSISTCCQMILKRTATLLECKRNMRIRMLLITDVYFFLNLLLFTKCFVF